MMRTRRQEPPEGLHDAVIRVASELFPARLGQVRTAFAEGQSDVTPTVLSSRELHILGLDAIAEGRGPDAAVPVGWIVLVAAGGAPAALAEATIDDEPVVQSLNYGPFVDGLAEAAEALGRDREREREGGEQGLKDDRDALEERVLRVPGAYFTGLWLHDEADVGRDRIVPVAPVPDLGVEPGERIGETLRAGRAYRWADVLGALRPIAVQRLSDDERGDA